MPSLSTRIAIDRIRADLHNRLDAIDGSYTVGGSVLSSTAGSSDATITVSAHSRVYPSDSGFGTVSLSSGTITGVPFEETRYVYYDDTTLSSTSPTYFATDDGEMAQANYVSGRHPLGPITTPSSTGSGTSGGGAFPPGGGGGFDTAIP